MSAVDVFATGRCPVGRYCETCGQPGPGRSVTTVRTTAGVLCLTLCSACTAAGPTLGPLWWPPRMADGGARLVGLHCEHLGISVDEMVVAIADRESDR